MEAEGQLNRWQKLWEDGTFKNWHLTEKNPDLWKFLHILCPDDKDKSGLLFVPMCGKVLDLKFLYEEGFKVVGAELCEEVVKDFFTENSLTYEIGNVSESLKVYSTSDQRLRVFSGDFMTMKKEHLDGENISMVWDRGAFGSISKDLRKTYTRVMKELMEGSKVRYLLDCYQYRDWYRASAPNNCPLELIEELFGDRFEIQELQRSDLNPKAIPHYSDPNAKKLIYFLNSI